MKHLLLALAALAGGLFGWWRSMEPPPPEVSVEDAAPTEKRRPAQSAPKPSAAGLSMPAPEPCIELEDDIEGDRGMVASAGLAGAVLNASLAKVEAHALSCAKSGAYRMTFDLLVGCDGVVKSVSVTDGDGAPDAVTGCVGDVLRHADFPAHDMPDGLRFPYTLSVEF